MNKKPTEEKTQQLFLILSGIFITNALLAEIMGVKIFSAEKIFFNQTPMDKLNFIKSLQEKNKKVLMIGDGLNDAGALKQSDTGIVITENMNNFTPACDGILKAKYFSTLPASNSDDDGSEASGYNHELPAPYRLYD